MDRVQNWKAGDVALVRLDRETEIRVMFTNDGWRGVKGSYYDLNLSPRPLVVIDPEDEDLPIAHALWERLFDLGTSDFRVWRHHIREVLNGLANPTPPIEEPTGLGAVVEDAEGYVYVRGYANDESAYPWHVIDPSANKVFSWHTWDRLNVARVLSEGVPAEAKS